MVNGDIPPSLMVLLVQFSHSMGKMGSRSRYRLLLLLLLLLIQISPPLACLLKAPLWVNLPPVASKAVGQIPARLLVTPRQSELASSSNLKLLLKYCCYATWYMVGWFIWLIGINIIATISTMGRSFGPSKVATWPILASLGQSFLVHCRPISCGLAGLGQCSHLYWLTSSELSTTLSFP